MGTAAFITTLAAAALTTNMSANESRHQRDRARTEQEAQDKVIAEEKATALSERKSQIDAQREQMGLGTRGGSTKSKTQVKASIGQTSDQTLG